MERRGNVIVPFLLLIGIGGCHDSGSDEDVGHLIYTSSMGLEVWGTGSGCSWENSRGVSSNGMSWVDQGYATWDDLGQAMDAAVNEFVLANPTVPAADVWSRARSARYYIQDDYVFIPGPNAAGASFAAGSFGPGVGGRARITLALWSRGTTEQYWDPQNPARVPADSPPWTVRSPSFAAPTSYPYWRYGTKGLVPALAHELGNFWGLDPE